jgi:hypothetical protein
MQSDFERSSITIASHSTRQTVDDMREAVDEGLPLGAAEYSGMGLQPYRLLVAGVQDCLSGAGYVRRIVGEVEHEIREHLQGDRFLIQTNLYLRASRPMVRQETEAVGWHRESFYGANLEKSVNVWTPLAGVTPANTLRFVPGSQLIPEEDIKVEVQTDGETERYSAGHKIGFVYAIKKIVAGVDLHTALPMLVPDYHSGIFPGSLIHGSAGNSSAVIRFSVDFRILPLSAWSPALNKSFHFASGKPYFEEY